MSERILDVAPGRGDERGGEGSRQAAHSYFLGLGACSRAHRRLLLGRADRISSTGPACPWLS